MALQQLGFRLLEGIQQRKDAQRLLQRLIQRRQGGGGQRREGRHIVGVAEVAGGTGTGHGPGQARIGKIGGGGDAHQSRPVPDPQGDGAALGPFHLLGVTAVNLDRGVGAAASPQVPAAHSFVFGQGLQSLAQGRHIKGSGKIAWGGA